MTPPPVAAEASAQQIDDLVHQDDGERLIGVEFFDWQLARALGMDVGPEPGQEELDFSEELTVAAEFIADIDGQPRILSLIRSEKDDGTIDRRIEILQRSDTRSGRPRLVRVLSYYEGELYSYADRVDLIVGDQLEDREERARDRHSESHIATDRERGLFNNLVRHHALSMTSEGVRPEMSERLGDMSIEKLLGLAAMFAADRNLDDGELILGVEVGDEQHRRAHKLMNTASAVRSILNLRGRHPRLTVEALSHVLSNSTRSVKIR